MISEIKVTQGIELLKEAKYDLARQSIKVALKVVPYNDWAYYYLAISNNRRKSNKFSYLKASGGCVFFLN